MQTAMIWGASGGIGRALVETLIDADFQLFALSRQTDDLSALPIQVIEADPCDEFSVQRAVLQIAQQVGEVDLWIYAAGDIASSKVAETDRETFQRILDANLTGAFLTTHHSLPLLAADAHLFYLGAYSEKLQLPGLSAYAAAKAGLGAFITTLRKEERQRKITNVRPSAVETAFWGKVPMRLPRDARDAIQPAEIATQILTAYQAGKTGELNI